MPTPAGVDDLFSGASEPEVDPRVVVRPLNRWCLAAGLLNYAAFIAGIGMVFLRGVDLAWLPDPLGTVLSGGFLLVSLLAAPGAFVSVWAWVRADETLRKARTGALPAAIGPAAYIVRQKAFVLLGVSAVCLVVQIWALQSMLSGAGGPPAS